MKINGKVKLAIAALVLAGCAFGGYHYYEGQQAAKQTAAVETTKAVRMDMKSTVSATGTIQPFWELCVWARAARLLWRIFPGLLRARVRAWA